ncbi:MAG: hypothetical protein K5769_07045 [Pseudobutyrivibrio sp.]|nr:hypothetical protein [Pseudobutyrivibrio sp.]
MRKILNFTLAAVVGLSLCACSASTVKSDAGQIKVSVKDSTVKLNHVEYIFPEGYNFFDATITEPIGMSVVEVKDQDGNLVGVCSDGLYKEDITKDNIKDAVNAAYMTFHNIDKPLELSDDMFVEGKKIEMLVIGLDDGQALFMAQLGTPNFVYATELKGDSEYVMDDFAKDCIKQLGGEEEYKLFFGE